MMPRAQVAEAKARLEQQVFTAAELEALYGVPESTWHYYAFAKKGPASFKIGRRRVWRREAVEQWMAEQEAQGR
jgi:prophage regulatory protein